MVDCYSYIKKYAWILGTVSDQAEMKLKRHGKVAIEIGGRLNSATCGHSDGTHWGNDVRKVGVAQI